MKYIIVETSSGCESAILFDEILFHDKVAGSQRVVSAGFCCLSNDGGEIVPIAYGKSVSLGLASRPEEDAKIIADALRRRV